MIDSISMSETFPLHQERANFDIEYVRNLVDLRVVSEIIEKLVQKSGEPINPQDSKAYDQDEHIFHPYTEETLERLRKVRLKEDTTWLSPMSGGLSDDIPTLTLNPHLLRDHFSLYKERSAKMGIPEHQVEIDFRARMKVAVIHEYIHIISYMSQNFSIATDEETGTITNEMQLGFTKRVLSRSTPVITTDKGRSVDFSHQETRVASDQHPFLWLNEAMTEKLAREVGREYFRRTGERTMQKAYDTKTNKPKFGVYDTEVEVFEILSSHIAERLDIGQDALWRSSVLAYIRDPDSYLSEFQKTLTAIPGLTEWFKNNLIASVEVGNPTGINEKELKEILNTAGEVPSSFEAVLHLDS